MTNAPQTTGEPVPSNQQSDQTDSIAALERNASPRTAQDPVCGMDVDRHWAKHQAEHRGDTYDFCSASCRAKDASDPTRHLEPVKAAPTAASAGLTFARPMHPEIRQARSASALDCRHLFIGSSSLCSRFFR
jgi:YHS domain-containing protein